MFDVALLTVGGLGSIVAALYRRLERLSITPPLLGMIAGIVLGPEVFDILWLEPAATVQLMETSSRLLLAVALMGIALRYPFRQVRARAREVAWLLLIVTPGMAAIVAVSAVWLLEVPIGVAIALGACLASTDPVLASGIVSGDAAERDIPLHDRQILSLESGANDGLIHPLLTLGVVLSLEMDVISHIPQMLYSVVVAVVAGALIGTAGGHVLTFAEDRREIGPTVRSLYAVILAVLLLGLAGVLNVDGFVAVFVGGLAHNRVISRTDREAEVAIDEALNHFLNLPVFLLFGVVLPWADWFALGWQALAIIGVMLVLRRVPIVLLMGKALGMTTAQSTWIGWFGPVGVFALYGVSHGVARGVVDPTFWAIGTLAVATSTVIHGITAAPSRLLYRRMSASDP